MSGNNVLDLLIIGGGPAALAEVVLRKGNLEKVAVVSDRFGGGMGVIGDDCLQSYISELMIAGAPLDLRDFVGRSTANSPTGLEYTRYIAACFERLDVSKRETRVEYLSRADRMFQIRCADSDVPLRATKVILATGVRSKQPDARVVSSRWMTCFECYGLLSAGQMHRFAGRRAVIFGSGNTAFQLARGLARHAREITLFTKGYQGVYPIDSTNRFALRSPSLPTIDLVMKTANPGKSIGALNFSSFVTCPIWLHAFDQVRFDPASGQLQVEVPKRLNAHTVLASSVQAAEARGRLRAVSHGRYLWSATLGDDTVLISAIGVSAAVPASEWSHLIDPETGSVRHVQGWTDIDGLYVAGGAAGYASVNEMVPVRQLLPDTDQVPALA